MWLDSDILLLALDSPEFWAMAHWEGAWLEGVRLSLHWLWRHLDAGQEHETWELGWATWRTGPVVRRGGWRSLLRRAQAQAVLQEAWTSACSQHTGCRIYCSLPESVSAVCVCVAVHL